MEHIAFAACSRLVRAVHRLSSRASWRVPFVRQGETDLFTDFLPAVAALRHGVITAEYQFKGLRYPLILAFRSLVTGGDGYHAARLVNVSAAAAGAASARSPIRSRRRRLDAVG
jgi:hypothetical protein